MVKSYDSKREKRDNAFGNQWGDVFVFQVTEV
jgi:hypothetical protein